MIYLRKLDQNKANNIHVFVIWLGRAAGQQS